MSASDQIFISAPSGIAAVATMIAEATGMRLTLSVGGEAFLQYPAGADGDYVGGDLQANYLADPEARGPGRSLTDRYEFVLDLEHTGRDRESQYQIARGIFARMSAAMPTPLAFLRGGEELVAASLGDGEPTWLPPGLSPAFDDYCAWARFEPDREDEG